jgi:hypothetical protein
MRGRGERSERERGQKGERGMREERKERGPIERKVGCEKGRGRREERRRTEEKGNGGMGEGRAARNGWAGGSGGRMCSVCPASACVAAKVEAGFCPAAFAGDCGESTLPCSNLWRNRRTSRWTLALEEERGMRDTKDAPNEQKRQEAGQKVRKGWIEKTGRKRGKKYL